MHSLGDTLTTIEQLLGQRSNIEQERGKLDKSNYSEDLRENLRRDYNVALHTIGSYLTGSLQKLVHFPPHHERHAALLEEFLKVAPFEKSVFVMTKFPDGKIPAKDKDLTKVIELVRTSVRGCGHVPRLASDHEYHPRLWDNVELYLLGCSRAIAIVEGRSKGELNPNVAMEWGWMLGTGRKVLYLVEQKFKFQRADWSGLLKHPFAWESPAPAIESAIRGWLCPQEAIHPSPSEPDATKAT